ncbi:protein unc-13 homolog [Impatiens glandulifera]|uniref:protein unc-13 homolog n=1 Tax=Impatiens glandulifera TaxID=253017 RepID=UPI001FB0A443|nr:protein unc-13 homolog [Impatiens glandulifera]
MTYTHFSQPNPEISCPEVDVGPLTTLRESSSLTPLAIDQINPPDLDPPALSPLPCTIKVSDLILPFGKLQNIDSDDLRETAYEIFFTSCRSSPGFGGRNALAYYNAGVDGNPDSACGSPMKGNSTAPSVSGSRVKRALGLRMLRPLVVTRRTNSMDGGGNFSCFSPKISPRASDGNVNVNGLCSPGVTSFNTVPSSPMRGKRPLTTAEIMRQQLKITEQCDSRLRKTLMRTLVGQMGRRPETIIIPLELLRHLKPSEFSDHHEYHIWQRRQLQILECGLILHPFDPIDKNSDAAIRLSELIRSADQTPLDATVVNSDTMRSLCNSVLSLSWRSTNTSDSYPAAEICHWADGYPLNVHIYLTLLRSIFDLREQTALIDEADEILELIKKTWTTLGVNRPIHNLCFMWVLFERFVDGGGGGGVESELLGAALTMMNEVGGDAKKAAAAASTEEMDPMYARILEPLMGAIKSWSEKRLGDYHKYFHKGIISVMENLLPLVFAATRILEEDVSAMAAITRSETTATAGDLTDNRIDNYIRSSIRNAFAQIAESENLTSSTFQEQEVAEALLQLATEMEELAMREKEIYSPILKKWHPIAAGSAAVTLHACYGGMLKQYLERVASLTADTLRALQRAGKLEKLLVQMVVEDSVECEDGGKAIVREMLPYEVETVIMGLFRDWIQDRVKRGKECINKAKENEAWKPKSKHEPYSQSAVELMKTAKEAVEDFFELPIGISDDLVRNFADALDNLFRDYIAFVANCGSKQSYTPNLPPLTRCSRDSKFVKLWKKAAPCAVIVPNELSLCRAEDGQPIRSSTSRGTQRLYIRLNTVQYILSQIHSLDKSLSLSSRIIPSPRETTRRRSIGSSSSYFEAAELAIQAASQHISEVAAYRLIFLDSNSVLYDSLYMGDVATSRIDPALRILKQNLTLLCAIVAERAKQMAVRDAMRASYESFLMVLLAGGSARIFSRQDHEMIGEDFDRLRKLFGECGEGLITGDVLERESEAVEGVVGLMGHTTEQLVEDFSIVACEASGIGVVGNGDGQKLPMPPTTGKWNRADPNTILRVLCHRNDRAANQFLKRTFQLARRR